jgi:glycosyl transferase family 4
VNPTLNLKHVVSTRLGYGRLGVKLAAALEASGVTVFDGMVNDDPRDDEAQRRAGCSKFGIAPVICWVSTPSHARGWWEGQTPMLLTMFESGTLPESFREGLHNYRRVLVPSKQNVELFSEYHDDVRYLPLGMDPVEWCYQARKPPAAEFRFLIGGSGPRKGTDLAVKAFRAAFPEGSWGRGPVPWLVLKNPRNEDFYGNRMRTIGGKIPGAAEIAVYADAHCYLQPSRGEGWGLQPLQAIAQGCPTILTDAHGHEAFAYLGHGIPAGRSKSDYFIFGDAGEWWEPDLAALIERMRWVYDNYDKATAMAAESSREAHKTFTWAKTAERFLACVGGREALMTPGPEPVTWVRPTAQLFPVKVRVDWSADICGHKYMFSPDVTYWESADVKRILFEAGALAADCITEDSGLLPSQLGDRRRAEADFCPTCHRSLGTGEKREDMILAAMEAGR